MKKLTAILCTLLLLLSCAYAEVPQTITAYVSVSDDTGTLVLAYVPVMVTDTDGDGALTIADALSIAHGAYHPDGAAAFAVAPSQYGMSMTRLWGIENGGSYGYYVNDFSAFSPVDPIAEGDHVKAYAFTDLTAWSDTYSFFAAPIVTLAAGQPVDLTLSAAGYDEAWNPVTLPVAGAVITVGGVPTEVITDAQGCAQLTLTEPGVCVISAISDTQTLVPPVCIVVVTE